MSETTEELASPDGSVPGQKVGARKRSRLVVLPVVLFGFLALLLGFALVRGDPSKLPSVLIGKPAPVVAFPPVEGLTEAGRPIPGLDGKELTGGQVSVVNFWASWCLPCAEEHPLLMALAKRGVARVIGVNYKDQPANAQRFIAQHGNPYVAVGADQSGRGAIEWGVYGMPETFVVDGRGHIVYKHVGQITVESLTQRLLPAIEKARAVR